MSEFRKGFFAASRRQESGTQQNYEETKKLQKTTHDAIKLTQEEMPNKQKKSTIHYEVSDFISSEQMSNEQLIKIVLNIQQEAEKLRKEISRL